VRVPQATEAPEVEKVTFLDRLFGFLNRPEVENFISKGKDYLEELELEKKGKEIVEKAKE
jgi:hypothetical protein